MDKNTYQELELSNGEKVKLTLNFARILKVKNDNPKLYEELMRIINGKDFDIIFDSLKVLYTGYLCANIGNEKILTEEEFIDLVPFDIGEINMKAGILIQGKKK